MTDQPTTPATRPEDRALTEEYERLKRATATVAEPTTDCVYDAWGADFGAQAGARCLHDSPEHQRLHHPPQPSERAMTGTQTPDPTAPTLRNVVYGALSSALADHGVHLERHVRG